MPRGRKKKEVAEEKIEDMAPEAKAEKQADVIRSQKKEHDKKFKDDKIASQTKEVVLIGQSGAPQKEKVYIITTYKNGIVKRSLGCVRKTVKGKKVVIAGREPNKKGE